MKSWQEVNLAILKNLYLAILELAIVSTFWIMSHLIFAISGTERKWAWPLNSVTARDGGSVLIT